MLFYQCMAMTDNILISFDCHFDVNFNQTLSNSKMTCFGKSSIRHAWIFSRWTKICKSERKLPLQQILTLVWKNIWSGRQFYRFQFWGRLFWHTWPTWEGGTRWLFFSLPISSSFAERMDRLTDFKLQISNKRSVNNIFTRNFQDIIHRFTDSLYHVGTPLVF